MEQAWYLQHTFKTVYFYFGGGVGGFNKTSYDNLMIILQVGVHYVQKMQPKML
jgi:hypothetical protein